MCDCRPAALKVQQGAMRCQDGSVRRQCALGVKLDGVKLAQQLGFTKELDYASCNSPDTGGNAGGQTQMTRFSLCEMQKSLLAEGPPFPDHRARPLCNAC